MNGRTALRRATGRQRAGGCSARDKRNKKGGGVGCCTAGMLHAVVGGELRAAAHAVQCLAGQVTAHQQQQAASCPADATPGRQRLLLQLRSWGAPKPRSCPPCRSRRRSSGCRTSRRRACTAGRVKSGQRAWCREQGVCGKTAGHGRSNKARVVWHLGKAGAAQRGTQQCVALRSAQHSAAQRVQRTCSAYSPDRRRPPLLSNTRNQA